MAKKWIINNGMLCLGHVELHRDLARDHTTTKGGGMWEFDKENNILYLFGRSKDFGPAKMEDVRDSFKAASYRKATIVFSTREEFMGAMMEFKCDGTGLLENQDNEND